MARHKKRATKVQVKPETGFSEMRTTLAEYPPYSEGCPKCHGAVVTRQRLVSRDVKNLDLRVCRCRTPGCDWEGRLIR